MSFGYETYRADTSVITSTDRSSGITFIEYLQLAAGTSGSKTYPLIASGGLFVQQNSQGGHTITIDTDALGNTRLNWTSVNGNSTALAVMAKKFVASASTFGINVANSAGEVFISSDYPGPQCVGSVDVNITADTNNALASGYTLYVHKTAAQVSMGSSANRFVVMGIPDSGTDDTWYATDINQIGAGQSLYVNVLVFTKAASYKLPRLFIYAIDYVTPTSSAYGIQSFSPSQKLLYDSGAENMALMDVMSVSYPAEGNTVTYAPNVGAATYIGIVYPCAGWEAASGTFDNGGYGAAKKVGGQITFQLMRTYSRQMGTTNFTTNGDPTSGLFMPVIDLTYLGYATSTGQGGGTTQSVPSITTQPVSTSAQPGATVSFSCAASGSPAPTYQWYRGGVAISGATASTYSFACTSSDNGAQFYCRASNTYGTAQTATVSLTVSSGSSTVPVSITADPQSQTVAAGNSASFSVSVSGTSPFAYQWYRGGAVISGATSSTYGFVTATGDNGATFYCVVTNGGGAYSTTSGTATLTVTTPPPNAPVISTQPSNVTANTGQVVYMTCVASPETRYAWYRNGAYVADGSSLQLDTSTQGTFSYYCLVYNGTTTTQSSTATLTVTGPSSSPYASYNNFTGEIDATDNTVIFGIYSNGSSDTGAWANGTGDGTLYTVSATGNFTPVAGSAALNTTYDFASVSGVSWVAPRPVSTNPGVSQTSTLNVSVSLKGGGVVATGTITMVSTNSGVAG